MQDDGVQQHGKHLVPHDSGDETEQECVGVWVARRTTKIWHRGDADYVEREFGGESGEWERCSAWGAMQSDRHDE